ncbi:hypothetical protein [Aquiflexum gelatinilyticum]|uniref:hypothetical protein n=1 Tax=Aquiflexum gelatinilyticum TaxID=2961943 RepID=UPI002166D915|nr:hypothetical protein [Aquiflexum gelatinilyticum]MCS4436865.1 hypothetical protein [Aquiflexum gelatinilyticum]
MSQNLISFLLGFLVLAVVGCQSPSSQESTQIDSVLTEIVIPEEIYDPDPTDTIPGNLYGINSSAKETAELVRKTVQTLFKDDLDKDIIDEYSRKFIFFEYDLNEDGNKEIMVGFTGPYFCGSGGCTLIILDREGNVITQFTVSDYPVVIDNTKSNGWKDLFILSGGKYRIVKFDGKTYLSNPSMQPELKLLPGDGLPRALDFVNEPYPWFKF